MLGLVVFLFFFVRYCAMLVVFVVRRENSQCLPYNAEHQARYPLVQF